MRCPIVVLVPDDTTQLRNRIAVNIDGAATLLGLSENSLRPLLTRGVDPVPHFKHGHRTVIPVAELVVWAGRQTLNTTTKESTTP